MRHTKKTGQKLSQKKYDKGEKNSSSQSDYPTKLNLLKRPKVMKIELVKLI